MKKLMMAAVVLAITAGAAFAAPFTLSAGAGGYFTSDFGGGMEATMGTQSMTGESPYFGGGGFAFLDATYAELSVGFFGGAVNQKLTVTGQPDRTDNGSIMGLDIGLLGKFPFTLSEKLSVFPLLGVTYRLALSVKNSKGDEYDNGYGEAVASMDNSALWFKAGGGLDFSFTGHVFLRGSVLYGIRLASKAENDGVDKIKSGSPGADVNTRLGHGLEVKVAVGYRF